MTLKTGSRVAALCAALIMPAVASAQQSVAATTTSDQGLPARVEQRLTTLHSELRITPAEETSWGQYAQVVRANAKGLSQLMAQRHATLATMTATDNMQSLTSIADAHAQNMQRLSVALRQLYAAMPPDQQKNADQVLRMHSQAQKSS